MLWVTAKLLLITFPLCQPFRSKHCALSANPICSHVSSLLWSCLTSIDWSSKASSHDFPSMCKTNSVPPNHWISRVPYKSYHYMHKAYDCEASTNYEHRRLWHFINWSYCLTLHPARSARLSKDFAAQYVAYSYGSPCQRLTRHLTVQNTWLGVLAVCWLYRIEELHPGRPPLRFILAHLVSL
jgi:hypothetical protein